MSRHYPARIKNTYPFALESRPLIPSMSRMTTQSKTSTEMKPNNQHVFPTYKSKAPSAFHNLQVKFFLSAHMVKEIDALISGISKKV